jgi:hypothetical protein
VPARCTIPLFFCLVSIASAQFSPTLLQNRSYWGDGKSEIDFYNAEFMRDGQSHACELVVILTPLLVDSQTFAPIEIPKQTQAIPVIRMNQAATIPRGLAVEQRSFELLWRMDFMSLARLSFTGADPSGHVAKTISEKRQEAAVSWIYSSDTYTGKVDGQPIDPGAKQTLAYDELPVRLRTIDFLKPTGEFEVQIANSLANAQKEVPELKPAKILWKADERSINLEVQHGGGKDRFVLDANFPFLLREWIAADGMRWKMKNSLRTNYRDYLKNGDRERAFKDPMLRHPD